MSGRETPNIAPRRFKLERKTIQPNRARTDRLALLTTLMLFDFDILIFNHIFGLQLVFQHSRVVRFYKALKGP